VLRDLRNNLEDRLARAGELFSNGDSRGGEDGQASWQKLLAKWDETLSNALQLAPQKGVHAGDLDAETERLYTDHVAPERGAARVGAPGTRGAMRSYCAQVWKQARLWDRLQKGIRVDEFTFPGDPMRIDYAYRRNGSRGFVQTLSVSRTPGDVKSLAYTVQRIRQRVSSSEFTAVTDVHLLAERTPQIRAGHLARRGRRRCAPGRLRRVDREDAAADSVKAKGEAKEVKEIKEVKEVKEKDRPFRSLTSFASSTSFT